MKKIVSRVRTESEIPTSSMADIAFLLIIFFMVTTVFSATKGLELTLPTDEDDSKPAEEEEAVFIHVYDEYITVDCEQMEVDGILPYLEPILTVNATKPVILYTDAEAEYADMVRVYDVLAETKIEDSPWPFKVKNISIPTQSEVQEYIGLFGANPFETHCAQ
jgi:biopolymer transport protein ExbD